MVQPPSNKIHLQIAEIAYLLGLTSSTSLNNKARKQGWPHMKQSHTNGSPLHLYPVDQLPDDVQIAWAKWTGQQYEEAITSPSLRSSRIPQPVTKELAEIALAWPERKEYYTSSPKEEQLEGQSKKIYNGQSLGLCPQARQILQQELKGERVAHSIQEPKATWGEEKNISNQFVFVPHYKISASAGFGEEIFSEQIINHLAFHRNWVHQNLRVSPQDLALINVVGDSMEPSLKHKDLILIDQSQVEIKNGLLYVLRIEQNLIVKRLELMLNGDVLVKSDNREYQDQRLKPEDAPPDIIGRVIWFGREM